ncbi:hypothetical protein E5A73_13580 [Sphingomonas gei]|uniref:Uncharacterized protein n=1 Tax=Sphingomonas gei TaxID=1395960 RepID=A0A4S1XAG0_9SPHN|nr:hypothetical protein [Sphingomonas gei]TGX52673.1 hypothetical protein E5A73_13580 [Sphingomonas gei]
MTQGRQLVAGVREAAARHHIAWGELVPTPHAVNRDAEAAEDAAYAEMEAAKQRLRDHICDFYGISSAELGSLVR